MKRLVKEAYQAAHVAADLTHKMEANGGPSPDSAAWLVDSATDLLRAARAIRSAVRAGRRGRKTIRSAR